MAYALTETGLQIETFQELRESMVEERRGQVGPGVDLSDGAPEGQLLANVANRIADLGQLVESAYSATDPDAATGARLDALCALTGTQRKAARPSLVTLTLVGDDATEVEAQSQASVVDTGAKFAILEDATLALLDAWAATTAYVVGDRVSNGADRAYECIDAGVSAGSGGPTTTAVSIADGSVYWRYLGEGLAAADADAAAIENGPTVATSGSISVIETPVAGWNSVLNLLDADVGAEIETDEALRIRRVVEINRLGSSPADALRAALLEVSGVTAVSVFHNVTEVEDENGVPPHSVECLIRGGDDQDIWDALLASVGAGTRTFGDEVGTAVDSEGTLWEMAFSRPEEVEIFVGVVVMTDSTTYPLNGSDQVKAAIVSYGDGLVGGADIYASKVSAAASAVPGVEDVYLVWIGLEVNPDTSTSIPISRRQLPVFDTSRITVYENYVP